MITTTTVIQRTGITHNALTRTSIKGKTCVLYFTRGISVPKETSVIITPFYLTSWLFSWHVVKLRGEWHLWLHCVLSAVAHLVSLQISRFLGDYGMCVCFYSEIVSSSHWETIDCCASFISVDSNSQREAPAELLVLVLLYNGKLSSVLFSIGNLHLIWFAFQSIKPSM